MPWPGQARVDNGSRPVAVEDPRLDVRRAGRPPGCCQGPLRPPRSSPRQPGAARRLRARARRPRHPPRRVPSHARCESPLPRTPRPRGPSEKRSRPPTCETASSSSSSHGRQATCSLHVGLSWIRRAARGADGLPPPRGPVSTPVRPEPRIQRPPSRAASRSTGSSSAPPSLARGSPRGAVRPRARPSHGRL